MTRHLVWMARAFTVAVTLLAYDSRSLAQQSEEASAEAEANTGESDSQADAQAAANDDASAQSDGQSSTSSDSTQSDTEATTSNDANNGAVPPPANNQNETSDTESAPSTPPTNDADKDQSTENAAPASPAPSTSGDANANQAREQSELKRDQDARTNGDRTDASTRSRANADSRAGRDRQTDIRVGIQFGRVTDRGLTVNRIERNSFYYNSGFRQGDVIVSVNGRPIRIDAEFIRLIVPGQRVPVVVFRDGRRETLYIQYHEVAHRHPGYSNPQGGAYLGVTFDVQVRNAAVVLGVNPGSPAQEAGLQAGDVILALNGNEVGAYPDAIAMIRAMRPGDKLEIIVERARAERQIVAMLDSPPSVRTAARPDVQVERQTITTDQPADVRIDVNRQNYDDRRPNRERDYDRNRGRLRLPRSRN
jgi:membrane-associated protease RseP (regulator of RpoE activity)